MGSSLKKVCECYACLFRLNAAQVDATILG